MCGRYQLLKPGDIVARFDVARDLTGSVARNDDVRPTQDVPVVDMQRELLLMRWGIVPAWAQATPGSKPLINARAEGLDHKPSFRKALHSSRCIIPATGFYEWRQTTDGKVKYLFTREDGDLFGLAGLWETSRLADGSERKTCTIITTTPNALVAPVHNRMPVILTRDAEELWLNPDETESEALLSCLMPLPGDEMRAEPLHR